MTVRIKYRLPDGSVLLAVVRPGIEPAPMLAVPVQPGDELYARAQREPSGRAYVWAERAVGL